MRLRHPTSTERVVAVARPRFERVDVCDHAAVQLDDAAPRVVDGAHGAIDVVRKHGEHTPVAQPRRDDAHRPLRGAVARKREILDDNRLAGVRILRDVAHRGEHARAVGVDKQRRRRAARTTRKTPRCARRQSAAARSRA